MDSLLTFLHNQQVDAFMTFLNGLTTDVPHSPSETASAPQGRRISDAPGLTPPMSATIHQRSSSISSVSSISSMSSTSSMSSRLSSTMRGTTGQSATAPCYHNFDADYRKGSWDAEDTMSIGSSLTPGHTPPPLLPLAAYACEGYAALAAKLPSGRANKVKSE